MRVGTVAEGEALVSDTGGGAEVSLRVNRSVLLAEVVRDSAVVSSGLLESLERKAAAGGGRDLALSLNLLDDGVVVVRRANDRSPVVVLGSRAEESDTADVNLLNSAGDRAVRLLGLQNERVEVADNDGDLIDLVVGQVLQVRVDVARQDTAVDSGVKRLDATAEDLGGVGDRRNIAAGQLQSTRISGWQNALDLDAVLTDQLGRAARAKKAESESLKLLRERKEVGLVVDRQEGWQSALHTTRKTHR